MARPNRLLLASLLTTGVGMVLACGGAGNPESAVAPNPSGPRISKPKALRRAEAEAEAEATNDANRKAHEARVEQLKVAHKKQLDSYASQKLAYEKSVVDFQAAKLEYEATKKLALARLMYEESRSDAARGRDLEAEKSLEFAKRRFREIIDKYPSTQSAKDAKTLMSGGNVAARKTPASPVQPVAPTEPRALVLPRPPEAIAVVNPLEPEKIAELMIPYTVLKQEKRRGDGKMFLEVLVSEAASKAEVMKLAESLRRQHSGRFAHICIYDSREAFQRQFDTTYPEQKLYRHNLVVIAGDLGQEIRWIAAGRDH